MKKFIKYFLIAVVAIFVFLMVLGKWMVGDKLDTYEVSDSVSTVKDDAKQDSLDYYTTEKINALTCEKAVWEKRIAQNSAYTDLEKSSFSKKQIVFKEGFTNTEYYAKKKLMIEVVRALRDFPCMRSISVETTAEGKVYKCKMSIEDIESYFGFTIDNIRSDIKVWRKEVSDNEKFNRKENVLAFANKFVK